MDMYLLRKKPMLISTILLTILCTTPIECLSVRDFLSELRTKCIPAKRALDSTITELRTKCVATRDIIGRALTGLKTVGKEVAKDIKAELVSPYQDIYYGLKNLYQRKFDTIQAENESFFRIFRGIFKHFLWNEKLIWTPYYLFKQLFGTKPLQDFFQSTPTIAQLLSQDEDNACEEVQKISSQILKMGLNPEHIHIHKSTYYDYACVVRYTFTALCQAAVIVPMVDKYSLFGIGHELAHIHHQHHLKVYMLNALLPYIVRTALITTNTLVRMSLKTLKECRSIDPNSKPAELISWVEKILPYCLRNPLLEWIYCKRFCIYYMRKQEREADITSACTFNCAKEAIQEYQSHLSRLNSISRFDKILLEFLDEHPSSKERIKYLTPIATKQAQEQLN